MSKGTALLAVLLALCGGAWLFLNLPRYSAGDFAGGSSVPVPTAASATVPTVNIAAPAAPAKSPKAAASAPHAAVQATEPKSEPKPVQNTGQATLHYASGNNIDARGAFAPAQIGFNLADISSVSELQGLPAGVQGLVWLDQTDGVTQSFIDAVQPYIGNPKLYGFFLKDEPDPTGQWGPLVSAANLKAESDWIHAHAPGAKTFITMMNMGPSDSPSFANTYTPANTHVDLFGLDPYPVRSESAADYGVIDRTVAAAKAAGIPLAQIVPVFQAFGGGNWVNDLGGRYVMPTAAQEQQMLDRWAALAPNPSFDYAYTWGSQNGDTALEDSQALQNVFLQHNRGR